MNLRPPPVRRLAADRGIAIGPILFVIAIMALLATAIASNMGTMSNAGTIDRLSADIPTQANLIRAKINECYTKYGTNLNLDGYPTSSGGAVDVSTLTCEGDAAGGLSNINLWTGPRPASLPAPTAGFSDWQYVNSNASGMGGSAAAGRCIYIAPTLSSPAGNPGIVDGLTRAAAKFTHQTDCDNSGTACTAEVIYNPASASQKFIMWITLPTGTPNSSCLP